MSRALSALAAVALALSTTGCALLRPSAQAPAAAEALPAGPPSVEVQIDAPQDLRALLQRHLDLVRLAALARGETVTDTELSRLVDATPSQVRELLETEGYFSPEIRVERGARPANGPEQVRVVVQPGRFTRVTRVDFEVEGPLAVAAEAGQATAVQTLQQVRAAWLLKPGAAFRNPVWSEAKNAAIARLRAAGYAAAAWSGTAVRIDPDNASARIFVVADAGPLFRSGEFEIEGLKLHDRQTVLNLADFGPGTPVTETLLLDFQDRLQKSGLFERAAVTLDADPAQADSARIEVRVDETARHQLIVGVGVSANTGPRATVEHIDRRLFGQAAIARNKVEWGRSRQAWDGEISTHPRPGLHRWLTGVSIERLEGPDDVVLSQRVRLGRAQTTPRIDRLAFGEVDRSSRRTALSRTDSTAYSGNYHWTLREVDNPILPIAGYTVALQGGAGVAMDNTDRQGGFGRVYARLNGYLPVGNGWYAQARVEVGQVAAPYGLTVPDTLRFRAGGDDSVRGYAYRSLGPQVAGTVGSGDVLLAGSVEIARPLSDRLPQLWGAVFVDAGNAANRFSDWRAAVGTGVGLRWRSPVGPLRLDLAYGHETRRTRLHFSVGIAF